MSIKRSILLSAIRGFSPEIQPIKETAIDKIYDEDLDLCRITGNMSTFYFFDHLIYKHKRSNEKYNQFFLQCQFSILKSKFLYKCQDNHLYFVHY